jgi:hypothetical protein
MMMAGFNVGALFGQLAVIVPGFFVLRTLQRWPVWLPRFRRAANWAGAAVGAVWLIRRLWLW